MTEKSATRRAPGQGMMTRIDDSHIEEVSDD
jgi:hypothetical protein